MRKRLLICHEKEQDKTVNKVLLKSEVFDKH